MLKLKFLILFIFFIQVIPKFIDLIESELEGIYINKCDEYDGKYLEIKTAAQCAERNSFLPKEDYGSKCCFYTTQNDPIFSFKQQYGENWKKIVAQNFGYDLNISEEEIRKKLTENVGERNLCQYLTTNYLYGISWVSLGGIVKYDCGEGEKIFNKNEFHPATKDEIIDKELIDAYFSLTEKDCLKSGIKLSDDEYQICWCEKIRLDSWSPNIKKCYPYRISTFQERLKKEMDKSQQNNRKLENKCTCTNNKGKTTRGYYNSVTGEVKVEQNI